MATFVVKKSLMHRYQTIGQAIQDAQAGDFIEIRDGIYEESIDISKRLTIYGIGDVTIRGGVFVRFQTHVEMRNIRFSQGQGIYIKGNLQLENCIVEQQLASAQVTVNYGSLLMSNVDILGSQVNKYGLRIDNGSSVVLDASTIQHHAEAQIIVQNSDLSLTNCLLLEGQMKGIFAIRNVKLDIADCEIHGHSNTQIVAASSTISIKRTLIHEGQDIGIQIFDGTKLEMDGCEVKMHGDTSVVVHESELLVADTIFADGQGNGIYIGEKSKAIIYDCQLLNHIKAQLFIENSTAEIRKSCVKNGSTTGVTVFNEANVTMTECKIEQHAQYHFIVDASGLQLDQCSIQFGQAGGIYGNDHAKLTLKNTIIQKLEKHHIYINNARLFTENCTLAQINGNGITCIDAIFEISNNKFLNCEHGPYAIIWSDKSMGRIKNCLVEKTERPFLAISNQSLLEMVDTDLTNAKTAAVVQDKSQLYVRGFTNLTNWQADVTSKIVNTDTMHVISKEKIQQIINMLSGSNAINVLELKNELQFPAEVLQEIYNILQSWNIKKTM